MSVYRQKNFFDRWKKKSQRDQVVKQSNSRSGRPYIKSPVPDTYRTTKPNIFNTDVKYSHINNRKEISVRGKMEKVIEPTGQKHYNRDFPAMTDSKMWLQSEDTNQWEAITSHTSDNETWLKDTTVQTDDILLESLYFGLRKRMLQNANKVSNDVDGFPTNFTIPGNEESNAGFECGECEYLFLDDATQSIKTCGLHLDEEEENDPTIHSNVHSTGENLPLLGNTQTSGYNMNCDSTSEESLSDHNENFDELDELLADVCPHKGSFGSVHQESFIDGKNKHEEHLSCAVSDPANNPNITGMTHDKAEFFSICTPNTSVPCYQRNNLPETSSTPILLPMKIPDNNFVDQNEFQDGHRGTNQQCSVASSSGSSINSSSIPCTIRNDTMHNVGGQRSEKCSSSDTSDDTLIRRPHDGAIPKIQSEESTDETDKSKFQEFLRTRGVDLDPTAIQHSDF